MRRALHGYHPRRAQDDPGQVARRRADAEGHLQGTRRLCHRAGPRQARAVGRRAQSLQAPRARHQEQRRRACEIEHPARRPDRVGQDLAGPNPRPHHRRALHDGRCDDAYRGRLCRRGCREHHPEAIAGRRLQCRARAAWHRLYRRGRQDQPQIRQSLDHPRRLGRGCAAGAAQDHGRHRRLGAAAGRTQASAAGIPSGRYHQYPLHMRRRLRRAREAHLAAPPRHLDRLRRRGALRPRNGRPARF